MSLPGDKGGIDSLNNCPAGRQDISSTVSSTFTGRKADSVEVESILWTYQVSTSINIRELRHENCKIIQEFHGDNTDKTLTMAALSFTELKRILLSFKT